MNKKIKTIMLGSISTMCLCIWVFLCLVFAPIRNNGFAWFTTSTPDCSWHYAYDAVASDAEVREKGGAIYLEAGATFTLTSGTISGCKSVYGGAIYVSSGATFIMEGGTICNNQAKYGGAIYVEQGGICKINGGTIINNEAYSCPAIYMEFEYYELNSDFIVGRAEKVGVDKQGGAVSISESAVIENNNHIGWEGMRDFEISKDTITIGSVDYHYFEMGKFPKSHVGSEMQDELETWWQQTDPSEEYSYNIEGIDWRIYNYENQEYARGVANEYVEGVMLSSGEIVNGGDIIWLKVEPIKWIIFNYWSYFNGMRNICAVALDGIVAMNFGDNAKWEESSIRTWLNNEFYTNVFSSEERELIFESPLSNPHITHTGSGSKFNGDGPTTYDKVFLLDFLDVYGQVGSLQADNSERFAYALSLETTDFALATSVGTQWWSRTRPILSADNVAYIFPIWGKAEIDHHGEVSIQEGTFPAVRPAINLIF